MTIDIYPEPSGTSTVNIVPPGASGDALAKGMANKNGFSYTSTTLSAGPKAILAFPSGPLANRSFIAYSTSAKQSYVFPPNENAMINLTTSETKLTIYNYNWTTGSPTTDVFYQDTALSGPSFVNYNASNGVYMMALNNTQSIAITTNFSSWTTVHNFSVTIGQFSSIAYGNNYYVCFPSTGGTNNQIAVSTNGTTWSSRGLPGTAAAAGKYVAHNGNDRFFTYLALNAVYISTDALTWSSVAVSGMHTSVSSRRIFGGNNLFVVPIGATTTGRTQIWYSTNATTWATAAAPGITSGAGYVDCITYGNGIYVGVGLDQNSFDSYFISSNLTTWTYGKISGTTNGSVNCHISFSNGVFYANFAYINWQSLDGVNWTTSGQLSWSSVGIYAPVYGDNNRNIIPFYYNVTGGLIPTPTGSPTYYELYNMTTTALS